MVLTKELFKTRGAKLFDLIFKVLSNDIVAWGVSGGYETPLFSRNLYLESEPGINRRSKKVILWSGTSRKSALGSRRLHSEEKEVGLDRKNVEA